MDNIYDMEQMNYYNNNNFYHMNLDPFGYVNGVSNGKKTYLRDQIMPKAKNKKKHNRINSLEENIGNLYGNFNIFNKDINKINNNFGQRPEKKPALNFNVFNNHYNAYMNLDNYNPTEIVSPTKNQVKIMPFKYRKMYQKQKKPNNINNLKRNLNNQKLKHENMSLKKNENINNNMYNMNNMNINIPYKNNQIMTNQMKNFGKNNQFQPNVVKNKIHSPPNNYMNNNFILKNNIENNINYPRKNNLRNNDQFPNHQLIEYKEKNNTINQSNKVNNNKNIGNDAHKIRKDKIINDKPIENEDDESLSNIAEEIYNVFLKKNKKKKQHQEKEIEKDKKVEQGNHIVNNIIKNNDFEQVFNVSICFPPNRLIEDVGCRAEFSKSSRNSRRNSLSNFDTDNKKPKNDYKPKKVDKIEELTKIDKNNINAEDKNEFNNPIKTLNENEPASKNDNQIEMEGEEIENPPEENSEILFKKVNENRESKNIEIDSQIGKNIIESENEKENEDDKIKKKNRRIKVDLNRNIYFHFLKNDIMNKCQVRKGFLGDLEYFNPKKERDIFDSRIVFMSKPAIKPFNKDEIKFDKDYKLREKMNEKEIVPELYENEENDEIDDKVIEDVANSLRGSIDKSLDLSVNESIRRSINQSYNQNMKNSLTASINSEGQGILRKLKMAFEGSINKEF